MRPKGCDGYAGLSYCMMEIDLKTHCLAGATRCLSPNFSDRPPKQLINLLVLHNISLPPGEFGGEDVLALFCNRLDIGKHPFFKEIAHLRVSSHLFIQRNGKVWQCVPFDKCAWHAGESIFAGQPDCNRYSIGIELEGADTVPYTQQQYQVLANVTCAIMHCYPDITLDKIVGHSDISPARKTDPGPSFDWEHYFLLVKAALKR